MNVQIHHKFIPFHCWLLNVLVTVYLHWWCCSCPLVPILDLPASSKSNHWQAHHWTTFVPNYSQISLFSVGAEVLWQWVYIMCFVFFTVSIEALIFTGHVNVFLSWSCYRRKTLSICALLVSQQNCSFSGALSFYFTNSHVLLMNRISYFADCWSLILSLIKNTAACWALHSLSS